MAWAARINLALSALGLAIFVALFIYVSLAPDDLDRRSRAFVIERAQAKVDTLIERRLPAGMATRANALAAGIAAKLESRLNQSLAGSGDGLVLRYYRKTMDGLHRNLLIFSGSCTLAFALAGLLSLFRKSAARRLLPIAVILTAATFLAAAWYVFGQDWVLAIILNDYWGWSFAILLSVLSLLMVDIGVNRARITNLILNLIGGVFGIAPYTPC